MTQPLSIFISSTLEDLRDARTQLLRFLSVLRSDVLHMETFGSDESSPLQVSLDHVRNSNLFIGIYAERYGHIDSSTGKSITQLEYEEAVALHSSGNMLGILLYVLHPDASWR